MNPSDVPELFGDYLTISRPSAFESLPTRFEPFGWHSGWGLESQEGRSRQTAINEGVLRLR